MTANFKDMTPEADAARDFTLVTTMVEFRQLYGCSIARYSPNIRCELMDGHNGPCKYVHKGTWRESKSGHNTDSKRADVL